MRHGVTQIAADGFENLACALVAGLQMFLRLGQAFGQTDTVGECETCAGSQAPDRLL